MEAAWFLGVVFDAVLPAAPERVEAVGPARAAGPLALLGGGVAAVFAAAAARRGDVGGLAASLGAAAAMLGFGVFSLAADRRASRRLRGLLERGGLGGLRVEPGVLVAYYGRIGDDALLSASFVGDGGAVDAEEAWGAAEGRGFFSARGRGGGVFVAAPAVRVVDGCCRDAAVAAVWGGWSRGGWGAELEACSGGSCAEAELRLEEGGVAWWRLSFSPEPGGRARAARLVLRFRPSPPPAEGWRGRERRRAAGLAAGELVLGEVRGGGQAEGRYALAPASPRAAVLGLGVADSGLVRGLRRVLGFAVAPPLASLSARLVVDVAYAPDVVAEKELAPLSRG